MGYISSVLGLQARSRRNARNASRSLTLRRSREASLVKAHAVVPTAVGEPKIP